MLEWLRLHRRRVAPLVLGAAVLVVGGEWQRHAPDEVDVELPIGREHTSIRRVDVDYLDSGELVQHVSLRYPGGAPDSIRHTAHLPPGRYLVSVVLFDGDGTERVREGRLEAPAEGTVRVHLTEGSPES